MSLDTRLRVSGVRDRIPVIVKQLFHATESEPPLSSLIQPPNFGGSLFSLLWLIGRDVRAFAWVFTFRLRFYGMRLLALGDRTLLVIETQILTLKRFLLGRLMFRGGYFYQTHRLGMATIASTTVFSMFMVPVLAPIQEINGLTQLLLDESDGAIGQTAFVLENTGYAHAAVDETGDRMRSEVLTYAVEGGDTLGVIAEQFLVSVEALQYVNELGSSALLHPGDVLTIPPVGGLIHAVKAEETVSTIATLYRVSPQAIVDFNHLEEPFTIHAGDELVVPDAQVPVRKPTTPVYLADSGASQVAGLSLETIAPSQAGTGGFVMPAGGTISQYFWWGHTAIDLAGAGCGMPIVAADSGTITFAGWWPGGGGNSVFIDHGNGYVTKYAHMSGFERTGGGVNRGDVIGYIGATGRAFGCHLHFIVEAGGRPVDPLSVM